MKGTFNEIPLDELSTPKEGYTCMLNRFWLLGPGGGALSYDVPRWHIHGPQRDRYPQCNGSEEGVKRWAEGGQAGAVGYAQVLVAYWPPARE